MSEPRRKIRKTESLTTSRVESEDAVSTHDSSPPSETTDPCCYWCSRISLLDMEHPTLRDGKEGLRELFHSDCECRRGENALPSSACGFCKHLNIRHLVRCALRPCAVPPCDSSFTLNFSDWYCRENPQNGCQLCEYMASCGISNPEVGFEFYSCWKGCYLKLRWTNTGENHIRFSEMSVRRLQELVDWEHIRGWLSQPYMKEKTIPVDFRVIDVERNCIVSPNNPVNYVALSYVWGNSSHEEKPFQASMRNIEDLETEGSLSGALLPRTITDAMEVCRQLTRRYLWVDRLCIIQDDESKHGQIQRMDSIFGSSEFTIIAVSGQDAHDGLPGVSEPRQRARVATLEWQGLTITKVFPRIQDVVESSYWAQRGWTFQEGYCSKNNLYFTEYGIHQSAWDADTGDISPHAEVFTIQDGIPLQIFDFPDSVEAYAARSFTDPGDLLRAFTGVLNKISGRSHYFGSPARDLYKWIHWQPVDWEYEARRPPKDVSTKSVSHIQPHKTDIFPSWSWTSAQGGVRFYKHVEPVAQWAFPVAQESQEDSNVGWGVTSREASQFREITVGGGLRRAREFLFQPTNDLGLIPASSTQFEKADWDEACKKLGRILSFTQVASLRLKSLDGQFRCGRRTFQIISSAGQCMGGIWLPKLSLEYTFNKDGSLKEKEFEFMALSVYQNDEEAESILNSVWLEYSKDRAALNVMLICQAKDSNLARRLGIGQVFKDQWLKERPVLKTVILE